MATKSQITAEQYLDMTFEYDAEFVRGEIVERSLPDLSHSTAQAAVCWQLAELESPADPYPEQPPLIVVEILTADDRYHYLMQKLEEYRVWGVPNIWVVDPLAKRLAVYTDWGLQYVSSLSLALADYPLELTPGVLFSDL